MSRSSGRPRRNAAPLSPERILTAALARVNVYGMTGLTMRGLAGDLGVDPMALYYYVPNKAALVRALVEQIFSAFHPPIDVAAPWEEQVRAFALSYFELTCRHQQLMLAIATDPATAALAADLVNPLLDSALRAAGLAPAQVAAAAGLIIDYIHGFTLGMQHDPAVRSGAIEPGLAIILAGIGSLAEHP
jgi:TetR/AcrR family transcriptional regulator, tetracycline repressor protein